MKRSLLTIFLITFIFINSYAAKWSVAEGKMMTRWGKEVTPENVWQEYPRPQMVREQWSNLNGLWKYIVTSQDEDKPTSYKGDILVPFAIESALSGVGRQFNPTDKLWYKKEFVLDPTWKGKTIMLHFGAVDYQAVVWINGKFVGLHKGGYDAFSFDITPYLRNGKKQEIVVAVTDPTEEGDQARGKQQIKTGRIWYTPVSGIWQTVWLEPVAKKHIENVLPLADIDSKQVKIQTSFAGTDSYDSVAVKVYDPSGNEVSNKEFKVSDEIVLPISNMQLWSPSTPNLYTFEMILKSSGEQTDKINSYFAMRKIEAKNDSFGNKRMYLNNEFLFHMGTLDQGWWPDGLCTPPSPEAMKYDIEVLKQHGFNTLRKHIKVEPALYYYYADKLGIMIWQDMPSGFKLSEKEQAHVREGRLVDWNRPKESANQWETELKAMIDALRFFPSVVCWGVFNEGWGQYNTKAIVNMVVNYDKTRLVNGVSGWADRQAGPMFDIHSYPKTAMIPRELVNNRVRVIGEFGGLGLGVKGHLWNEKMQNWGYMDLDGEADLAKNYVEIIRDLEPLIMGGLSGAIYTQTSDVEGEVNGLITYDREVIKMPVDMIREAHERLYSIKPTKQVMLTGDSRLSKVETTYSLTRRNKATQFEKGYLPLPVNKNTSITAKSTFTVDAIPNTLSLNIGGLGRLTVWINGNKIGAFEKINNDRSPNILKQFNITESIKYLKIGENVIEVETGTGPKNEGQFTFNLCGYFYE